MLQIHKRVPWSLVASALVIAIFLGATLRVVRFSSRTPSCSSSRRTASLSPDALAPLARAPSRKPLARATATKAFRYCNLVITDVELVELRYAGKPAAFLRGFRALYFGILINCIILGWVNLAMEKILGISLNIPKFWAVVICMVITAIYTSISGLWGVLWTDLVQFILKMSMVILLAYFAKFWAVAHRAVSGAVDRVPPAEWQAVRQRWEAAEREREQSD